MLQSKKIKVPKTFSHYCDISGAGSYRLGNRRRLKYAPPPDLAAPNVQQQQQAPPPHQQQFQSPTAAPLTFPPSQPLASPPQQQQTPISFYDPNAQILTQQPQQPRQPQLTRAASSSPQNPQISSPLGQQFSTPTPQATVEPSSTLGAALPPANIFQPPPFNNSTSTSPPTSNPYRSTNINQPFGSAGGSSVTPTVSSPFTPPIFSPITVQEKVEQQQQTPSTPISSVVGPPPSVSQPNQQQQLLSFANATGPTSIAPSVNPIPTFFNPSVVADPFNQPQQSPISDSFGRSVSSPLTPSPLVTETSLSSASSNSTAQSFFNSPHIQQQQPIGFQSFYPTAPRAESVLESAEAVPQASQHFGATNNNLVTPPSIQSLSSTPSSSANQNPIDITSTAFATTAPLSIPARAHLEPATPQNTPADVAFSGFNLFRQQHQQQQQQQQYHNPGKFVESQQNSSTLRSDATSLQTSDPSTPGSASTFTPISAAKVRMVLKNIIYSIEPNCNYQQFLFSCR